MTIPTCEHNKQSSWWLNDAKAIPIRRICDNCVDYWLGYYSPEVLGISGSYTDVVDDNIEPDDLDWGRHPGPEESYLK